MDVWLVAAGRDERAIIGSIGLVRKKRESAVWRIGLATVKGAARKCEAANITKAIMWSQRTGVAQDIQAVEAAAGIGRIWHGEGEVDQPIGVGKGGLAGGGERGDDLHRAVDLLLPRGRTRIPGAVAGMLEAGKRL